MYLRTVFGGHNLTAAQGNYLIRIKCAIILYMYVINVLYETSFKTYVYHGMLIFIVI